MVINKNKPKYFSILMVNYIETAAWGVFAPFFAVVVVESGGTVKDISIIWATYAMITGILMIIFGNIEDHQKNLKRSIVIGSFFLLFASVAYLFTDSLRDIFIAQMLYAVGFGIFNPALKKLFSKNQYKGKEAKEWAFMDGGNMILMSVATFIGGFILSVYSMREFYLFVILIFLFNFLFSLKLSRE